MLTRSLFRPIATSFKSASIVGWRSNVTTRKPISHIRYASSWDKTPEDLDAHVKVEKFLKEMYAHPSIVASLDEITRLLQDKKLIDPESSEPPSVMQMVKLMMDKDIRQAMQNFKTEMDKCGVNLGPDQLGPLMKVLGMEKK